MFLAEIPGVEPDEVAVESVDAETYTVSMLNAPGQMDIVVLDRNMNATIRTITPPLGNGKPLEVKDIEEALADLNIVFGINKEIIGNIVSEVADKGIAQNNVQIGAGEPAKDGVDAGIEFKFSLNCEDPETVDASRQSGKLDSTTVIKEMVAEGNVLAIKIPSEKPVNGSTVTGETLLGAESKDKPLPAGANTTILEDNVTCVVAEGVAAGYADYVDGRLCVEDPLQISGDKLSVRLSVHPPSQSGTMLTIEIVEEMLRNSGITHGINQDAIGQAKGEILVGEGIEGANVEAGAGISIKGGIIGSGEGKVHAGGDLTVRFIENAQVHANGNILIRNDIVRSNVSAGGSIICTGGKGRIRGGAVSAGKVIDMNEIGSPAGIITHVSVGVVLEFRENRLKIVVEENRIVKERDVLSKKLSATDGKLLTVKARGAIYSGTTVFVSGYVFKVKDDIKGKVAFIFDKEELAVKMVKQSMIQEKISL